MPERNDVTTISTTPEIKEKLEQYREINESWDTFFKKVLILIEQDIKNSI